MLEEIEYNKIKNKAIMVIISHKGGILHVC